MADDAASIETVADGRRPSQNKRARDVLESPPMMNLSRIYSSITCSTCEKMIEEDLTTLVDTHELSTAMEQCLDAIEYV